MRTLCSMAQYGTIFNLTSACDWKVVAWSRMLQCSTSSNLCTPPPAVGNKLEMELYLRVAKLVSTAIYGLWCYVVPDLPNLLNFNMYPGNRVAGVWNQAFMERRSFISYPNEILQHSITQCFRCTSDSEGRLSTPSLSKVLKQRVHSSSTHFLVVLSIFSAMYCC